MPSREAVERKIQEEMNEFQKERQKPTIMLLGATGCGKSTLTNTLFGRYVAEEGSGAPITRGFKDYENENITIVDSEGWETDTVAAMYVDKVKEYIADQEKKGETVNLIWYCISVVNQIQDMDLTIISNIYNATAYGKKLCIVLTKCDRDTETREYATTIITEVKKISNAISCFCVSNNSTVNNNLDRDDLGINNLMKWSISKMDGDELKRAFIAAQIYNMGLKEKQAAKTIKKYTALAAGIAVSPIPFSDSIPLSAMQIKMMADLAKIYGFSLLDDKATESGKMLVAQAGKFVAKFIASSTLGEMLKLIPVIGTVAGTVINTGVASSITYGIGVSTSKMYSKTYKKILNGESYEPLDIEIMLKDDEFVSTVQNCIVEYDNSQVKNKLLGDDISEWNSDSEREDV